LITLLLAAVRIPNKSIKINVLTDVLSTMWIIVNLQL